MKPWVLKFYLAFYVELAKKKAYGKINSENIRIMSTN